MHLFDMFNKIPGLNQITGSFGEWLAKTYSKFLPGALVISDVLIDGADGYTSQIDLLIVGNKGIYVVEMKMYSEAKIYGNMQKSTWYYYKNGKKYDIYSPLRQNEKHVEYLKSFLSSFGDVPCFSIITMVCEDFNLSGENNPDTVICNSLPAMKRAVYEVAGKKPSVWNDEEKQEIYNYINNNCYKDKSLHREHNDNVASYKKSLEQTKEQKICPYCNAELVLRKGKYGEFYGCSNYPKCNYTMKK